MCVYNKNLDRSARALHRVNKGTERYRRHVIDSVQHDIKRIEHMRHQIADVSNCKCRRATQSTCHRANHMQLTNRTTAVCPHDASAISLS